MFQTKSLLKSSNISTGKIIIVELKLISVSFTIINLFLLVYPEPIAYVHSYEKITYVLKKKNPLAPQSTVQDGLGLPS